MRSQFLQALLPALLLWAALFFTPVAAVALSTNAYTKCVIYYDHLDAPQPWERHLREANQLVNMLGHFRVDPHIRKVNEYAAGDLEDFDVIFYLGSQWRGPTNALPSDFIADIAATSNTVAWIGANIWDLLQGGQADHLGMQYTFSSYTNHNRVSYKGKDLLKRPSAYVYAVDSTNDVPVVHATAISTDPGGPPSVPFAIQSSNFWYFSYRMFAHVALVDCSLVFADLLHDILDSGVTNNHRALVRIEDVNAGFTSPDLINDAVTALSAKDVKASIAAIPLFYEPGSENPPFDPYFLRMNENKDFVVALRNAQEAGFNIVAHGLTHQNEIEDERSGFGWEFWNATSTNLVDVQGYLGAPLPYDSPEWASNRVHRAFDLLTEESLSGAIWVTPHYAGSIMNKLVFANAVETRYQRIPTFDLLHQEMTFDEVAAISSETGSFLQQTLPYVTYRSVYGSRFIPENMHYYDPESPDEFFGLELNISNKLLYAEHLTVVRDAVASFYFHLHFGEDSVPDLVAIIEGMEALGYTFTDAEALVRDMPFAPLTDVDASAIITNATTFPGDLIAGQTSTGIVLDIQSAIEARNAAAGVAADADANRIVLTGVSARAEIPQRMYVGLAGAGNELHLGPGSFLESGTGIVGEHLTADVNAVRVYNAVWSNRLDIVLGRDGSSNIAEITDGSKVASRRTWVGVAAGQSNRVSVSDNASWVNRAEFLLGRGGGHNELSLVSGASLESRQLSVGVLGSSTGNRVTVTNADAFVSLGIIIGGEGSHNELRVEGTSTFAGSNLVVGLGQRATHNAVFVSGSQAEATITGAVEIGRFGASNLVHLSDGALLEAAAVDVGGSDSGTGNELRVTNARLVLPPTRDIRILNGSGTFTGSEVDARQIVIASQGSLSLFDTTLNGNLYSESAITLGGAVTTAHFTAIAGAPVVAEMGTEITVAGDFSLHGLTEGHDLSRAHVRLVQDWGGLRTDAADQGTNLDAFVAGSAIGKLTLAENTVITNTVYVWKLDGDGHIYLANGARLYVADDSQWTGTMTSGTDAQYAMLTTPAIQAIDYVAPGYALTWESAPGLQITIERMTDFNNWNPITNVIGTGAIDTETIHGNDSGPGIYRIRYTP